MTPKAIALIGTLDTKGEEFAFLRDRIQDAGFRTIIIDVGVLDSLCLSPKSREPRWSRRRTKILPRSNRSETEAEA